MLLLREDSTSHPPLPLFFPVHSSSTFLLLSGALLSTSLLLVISQILQNRLTQHLSKNYFVISLRVIYWGLLSWISTLQGQRSRTGRNMTGGGQKAIASPPVNTSKLMIQFFSSPQQHSWWTTFKPGWQMRGNSNGPLCYSFNAGRVQPLQHLIQSWKGKPKETAFCTPKCNF